MKSAAGVACSALRRNLAGRSRYHAITPGVSFDHLVVAGEERWGDVEVEGWTARLIASIISVAPPPICNGSLNSSICVAPVGSTGVQDGDSSDDRPDARDGDSTARNPS
jgi:hypothetical protein